MTLPVNMVMSKSFRNRVGPIEVYKVVNSDLRSPLYDHVWREGWNNSSRKDPELTDLEKYSLLVHAGFHVHSTISDAFKELTRGQIILVCMADIRYFVACDRYARHLVFTDLHARFLIHGHAGKVESTACSNPWVEFAGRIHGQYRVKNLYS